MDKTEQYLNEMRQRLEDLDAIYLDELHQLKVDMNKENIDKIIELNRKLMNLRRLEDGEENNNNN